MRRVLCCLFLPALASACHPAGGESARAPTTDKTEEAGVSHQESDVCAFDRAVQTTAVGDDGLVDVPANHPHIFYMGRVDCENPLAPAFAFPGVSVRARFEGDALDLALEDFGTGSEQSTNYYDVSIDSAAPTLLEVNPRQRLYPLARDLPQGEHQVELVKRVESNHGTGKARFLGFRLRQGKRLLEVPSRPRRLEFIGDSITAGYGNELSTHDPSNDSYTTRNSNAHKAYGAIVAQRLNAEYVAIAASGRGVSRNYAGAPGKLVPELHRLTLPDQASPLWDHARYQPDVTVVNLGTNDYSTPGVDRKLFRSRYQQFLSELRQHYPQTAIIVAVGPMLNDEYPPEAMAWTTLRQDVAEVIKQRRRAGDGELHYVEFAPQGPPFGEDWHPTVATHARMADVLTQAVEKLLNW
jgi:lysophospholipase L1-like esterase